jgi:hypothetical protein
MTRPKCPKSSESTNSDAGSTVRNVRFPLGTGHFGRPRTPAHTEAEARVLHRPAERVEMAREARRLAVAGLLPRDIAAALGLSEAATRDLLREPQP